jgi:type III pantothenate kinase
VRHLKICLVVGDPAVKLGIEVLMDMSLGRRRGSLVTPSAVVKYQKPLRWWTAPRPRSTVDGPATMSAARLAGINPAWKHCTATASCRASRSSGQPRRSADTLTAMQSGIYFGYVGLVEGIVTRIQAGSAAAEVVATGGLAPLFHGATPVAAPDQEIPPRPDRDLPPEPPDDGRVFAQGTMRQPAGQGRSV